MPLVKTQAEGINLADTFAFSGTVSGAGGGVILKVVSNTFTTMTTISNTTADFGLSCAITPTKANSLLMISASILYSASSNDSGCFITDSSNNVIQQPPANGNRFRGHFGTHYGSSSTTTYDTYREYHTVFVTHAGTSEQTFKVRAVTASSSALYTNRNVYNGDRFADPQGISTMIIQEIAQ